MIVTMVYACSDNGVIGRDGDIPWRLGEDHDRFRAATRGKAVIMGSRTFRSVPGLHRGRDLIVLSSRRRLKKAVTWAKSLSSAMAIAEEDMRREVVVAGGATVYAEAMALADVIYQTVVHLEVAGDVFAPRIPDEFEEVWRRDGKDARPFTYRTLARRGSTLPSLHPIYGLAEFDGPARK